MKGSEARRGVQGRKRDHGIISTNRTIHELSVTVYVHSTGVIVQSATERIPYPNRTPERPQPRCSYHSPGRGWRGNWHGHGPTPAFAPVQSAGVLWHVGHRGCDGNWHGCRAPRPPFAPLQPADVLWHVLHCRFLRFLLGLSFPRSPFRRLRAGAGRTLAEAPTFVCPTIWTSSCALEFSGSAGIGAGLQIFFAFLCFAAFVSFLRFRGFLSGPRLPPCPCIIAVEARGLATKKLARQLGAHRVVEVAYVRCALCC